MKQLTKYKSLTARLRNGMFAILFLFAYSLSMVAPFVPAANAASGDLTVSNFEGQNSDGSWSPGNNTQYSEGDYVLYRFTVTNAAAETSAGGLVLSYSTCMFTSYFELVSSGGATVSSGTATSSQGDWQMPLTIAVPDSTSSTIVYKLKLSDTAGDCKGSSSHVSVGGSSGDFANVGSKDIPIPASSIYYNPSLTIQKVVQGGSALASDFSFTVSPAINGQSTYTIPAGQTSVTIDEVNPDGNYTITENGPASYYMVSGSGTNCTVGSLAAGTMNATVTAGRPAINATCVFTNAPKKGSIIINKVTEPSSDSTTQFSFDPSWSNENFTLVNGGSHNSGPLDAGTYSVSEVLPAGWENTHAVCSDGSQVSAISLEAGETVTCTFTNTKDGMLVVQKTTLPAGDRTEFPISVNAESGAVVGVSTGAVTDSTDATFNVKPGVYTVDETAPEGWSQTSTTCEAVTVAPGETKYCEIVNTKLGSIKVVKDAVPNSPQDFNFTATGVDMSSFALDDDADSTLSNQKLFSGLLPGNYTFTEAPTEGWDLSALQCKVNGTETIRNFTDNVASVDLSPGQNVTCTFTNTKQGQIVVKKVTDPVTDSTTEFTFDPSWSDEYFTLVNGGQHSTSVKPGKYSVAELATKGWMLKNATCDKGQTIDSINVAAGETVTCVFKNVKHGSFTVTKQTDPDGSDVRFSFNSLVGTEAGDFALKDGQSHTFNNLVPGVAVQVTEIKADGWNLSGLVCSDGVTVNAIAGTVTYMPSAGSSASCTFTNTKLGSISGTKWEADADGSVASNQGLPGWEIWLDTNNNSVYDELVDQLATTDENGEYTFKDLMPGVYSLYEKLKDGWSQIFAPENPLNLAAGQNATGNDFGNFKHNTVTGYKWNDVNGNGRLDKDEVKLSGWTIFVDSNMNGVHNNGEKFATTDVNGGYSLTSLAPGTYQICEAGQDNWLQTYPVGDDDEAVCHEIVVSKSGETIKNVNFGNQAQGSLTVIKNVYTDKPEGTETNVSGWTWNYEGNYAAGQGLTAGSGNTVTVPVSNNPYSVSENTQPGYHFKSVRCTVNGVEVAALNQLNAVSTEVNVTKPGDAVVCTFTNEKDRPMVKVEKTGPASAHEGDEVEYTFTVTNTGNVPLSDVSVADDIAGDAEYVSGDSDNDSKLDTNETWIFRAVYTVPENQIDNVVNTAVVTATPPHGEDVEDEDSHELDVLHPALTVTKEGPVNAQVNSQVTYTFTVKNTGDTDLNVTSVADNIAGLGAYVSGDVNNDDLLNVGETWVYNAKYTVPGVPGDVTNTVKVCAEDELEGEVCSTDSHTTKVYAPQVLGVTTPTPRAPVAPAPMPQKLADTGNSIMVAIILAISTAGLAILTQMSGRRNLKEAKLVATSA